MVMDSRTQFLLQLLQKLGAPLMRAVSSQPNADDTGEKDASVLAALLSESVKAGISLSQAMNLKTDDGDADAIRVCLATLAGGLIASSYEQTGRIPSETEGRRISKALEAVIVFADNFAPAAEHAQRLKTLDDTPPFFDAVQTNIYAVHALLPAIAAIGEFSFGQSETKLIQDVSERLGANAKDMQGSLGGNANPMGEIVVLQALGQVYAGVHRAETKRLKAQGGDSAAASMESVWAAFDKQKTMLDVLVQSMGGGSMSAGGNGGKAVKPETAPEAAPAAAPAEAPPPSSPPAGASPMAFFKKK